jgi:hypothetical protein
VNADRFAPPGILIHVYEQPGKDPNLVLLLKLLKAYPESFGVVPCGFLENTTEGFQRREFPKIDLERLKLAFLNPNTGILRRDAHARNLD